jgi:23S rRNA (uracil1939-C5)-methyltransferase
MSRKDCVSEPALSRAARVGQKATMTRREAETVELSIGALGAQGDGVGPSLGDGPTYVPLTLPGERVRARFEGDRGELLEVLDASPERIAPVSPHYGDCGGCALQHWAERPYLAWKREQVRLALARQGIETEIAETIACPPGTRRRLALHARRRPDGEAALGFKARRSWRLVEIAACPVAHPSLVEALPALRRLAGPFLEHPRSAPTLHATLTLSGIDVDVTGVERRTGALSADARVAAAEAAAAGDLARVTLGGEIVYQARQPVVRLGPATVALPAGAFLQATAVSEAAMAQAVIEAVKGARRIADLFCGVGTFSFRLAELAPVLAADSSEPALMALTAARGGAPGLKAIEVEARDLFRRPVTAEELKKIEAVAFDPPRAGAEAQAREIARSAAAVCAGVSCSASTFARDARILIDGGFRLERVTPVDQFLWSPHIELVGIFRR